MGAVRAGGTAVLEGFAGAILAAFRAGAEGLFAGGGAVTGAGLRAAFLEAGVAGGRFGRGRSGSLRGLDRAFLPGGGAHEARARPQRLERRFKVGGQRGLHDDHLFGDGMLHAQHFRMQRLTVQQGALLAVDLVPQQRETPVRELHADLVAATRLQLHFHDGVARHALHDPVVGDGALGAFGVLPLWVHHAHLQRLGLLDEMALQRALVFRQLTHEDGAVGALELVEVEQLLEVVQRLRRPGEDEHAGSEAVQAVDDVELRVLHAPAAVVVGDGVREAGLAALFGGHGEQARGLVHEEEMRVLPQSREGAVLGPLQWRQRVILQLGIVDHRDLLVGFEAGAVLGGDLAVHGDAAGINEALGLAVAHPHVPVQLRREGRTLMMGFDGPGLVELRHKYSSLPEEHGTG